MLSMLGSACQKPQHPGLMGEQRNWIPEPAASTCNWERASQKELWTLVEGPTWPIMTLHGESRRRKTLISSPASASHWWTPAAILRLVSVVPKGVTPKVQVRPEKVNGRSRETNGKYLAQKTYPILYTFSKVDSYIFFYFCFPSISRMPLNKLQCISFPLLFELYCRFYFSTSLKAEKIQSRVYIEDIQTEMSPFQ